MTAPGPMQVNLPYLKEDTDRHGNVRIYVRFGNRKIRLREKPGTVEFHDAYQAALKELSSGKKGLKPTIKKGTFEWLGESYMRDSAQFRMLDASSKATIRNVLRSCFAEPLKPGETLSMGQCPISALKSKHIRVLRDRKVDTPAAANNRLKYLSGLFSWAVEEEHFESNLVRDVAHLKYKSDGYHTWSVDEVEQFMKRHPIGTKPYLAASLLLFTGARGCDMVTFGRQHVKKGELTFRPSKTKKSTGKILTLPILPQLRIGLEAGPTGEMTFLTTAFNKSYSAAGFRNWFRERCDEAGLPHCTGHGLRKAGATIAAENGATEAQLMAIYGWETAKEAARYIRKARQRKLAAGAMSLIVPIGETDEGET